MRLEVECADDIVEGRAGALLPEVRHDVIM
jgi:hypothetical protein